MKIELIEVADASYQRAEERAGEYFAALKAQPMNGVMFPV